MEVLAAQEQPIGNPSPPKVPIGGGVPSPPSPLSPLASMVRTTCRGHCSCGCVSRPDVRACEYAALCSSAVASRRAPDDDTGGTVRTGVLCSGGAERGGGGAAGGRPRQCAGRLRRRGAET